ncbi:hypothetical protein HU200_021707 [Digitaria exilis]|uniref:Uncharacterized protein n=1 Tax=Digitaria exilis TaxID=1010633 RepID=A0A835EZH5_9POAL|nr:hypothetical protein HU200_021707 [Digitaria exilis]
MAHGFRCIHSLANNSMNFDAVPDGGRVCDGNRVSLSHWRQNDYMLWKIVPWCPMANDCEPQKNLEELVPRCSEVDDGPYMGAADGAEWLPLDMLKLTS